MMLEQSATRDFCLLLTLDIPERDQVSPFSSVIWLTWRRLLRWSADVCIELCNSFISSYCKVSPQLCDGSTVIHDICSSSSSSSLTNHLVLVLARPHGAIFIVPWRAPRDSCLSLNQSINQTRQFLTRRNITSVPYLIQHRCFCSCL